MHSAAIGAPTRLSMTRVTSSDRCRPWALASTRSPIRTDVAGLAGDPLTRTCPPRQAFVAAARVLYNLTAHSHRSTLVTSTRPSCQAVGPPDDALGPGDTMSA
jgi:hypothetical protein